MAKKKKKESKKIDPITIVIPSRDGNYLFGLGEAGIVYKLDIFNPVGWTVLASPPDVTKVESSEVSFSNKDYKNLNQVFNFYKENTKDNVPQVQSMRKFYQILSHYLI